MGRGDRGVDAFKCSRHHAADPLPGSGVAHRSAYTAEVHSRSGALMWLRLAAATWLWDFFLRAAGGKRCDTLRLVCSLKCFIELGPLYTGVTRA